MDFGVSDTSEEKIRVKDRDGALAYSCEGSLESAAQEVSSSGVSQHSSEADRVSFALSALRAVGSLDAPDADLRPPTPLADRENLEEGSPSSDQTDGTGSVTECLTPTEGVFDPFAPGADELMFAPKKRLLKLARDPLRRELKFDLCGGDCLDDKAGGIPLSEELEEEELFQLLYNFFLDVIVRNQAMQSFDGSSRESSNVSDGMETATTLSVVSAESAVESLKEELIFDDALKNPPPALPMPCGGFREGKLDENLGCSDGLRTPPTLPFLSGIADACPGAPKRPVLKSRKLSAMGICRKLEF